MGSIFAHDLASGIGNLSLERAIGVHLTTNHYPPVPDTMVSPCVSAIEAVNEGAMFDLIPLPDGITWKGQSSAPAYAIVESHHLDAWIYPDVDEAF